MSTVPMVEMAGISKKFPGVVANDRVSLRVNAGEIHALLGENGAGKSTLMSILTGLYRPDGGEIKIKGRRVEWGSPRDAVRHGIGMVHQHFKLVKPFTVAENIMLGLPGLKQMYDSKTIAKEIVACSTQYGLELDPQAKIWQLSVGEQQRVEIVKLLFRGAEILILDEPTAVLTPQETKDLYRTLRQMADLGKAVIVISHKLNEVMANTDAITVLRDGKRVGTVRTAAISGEELARMMVGRDIAQTFEKAPVVGDGNVLELQHVSALGDRGRMALKDISFHVRAGEILGIAGVAGNGQSDLAEVIAGLRKRESGKVWIKDKVFSCLNCKQAIDNGVGYIPEDRLTTGLVPNLNAVENMVLKQYRRFKGWFINWRQIKRETNELLRRFEVKSAGAACPVKQMSGGNLQKLLVAREIESDPGLILAVYPMRGLDVGAMESIRKLLIAQRAAGKGIILVSEELEELFAVSDRVAVMHAGEIMGIIDPATVTMEAVGLMMAGQRMEYHAS